MKEKIFIGGDHAGFGLKGLIIKFLNGKGYEVVDVGPTSYDKDDDYPDYTKALCSNVKGANAKGILVCSTGTGTAMIANKYRGLYAANCWNEESVRLAKVHQDINVLCMGSRFVSEQMAEKMLSIWLEEAVEREERHVRRLNKIKDME